MLELCMTRELKMRPGLVPPPSGYSLRWHHPGDRARWQRIQAETGIYNPIPPDLFEREFGEAIDLLRDRQCFAEDRAGHAVGTATCWLPQAGRDPREGRLHWVAVSPQHQRKGLGRCLTEAVCARMRELGSTSAYLTTGSANVIAVQLYLGLGFQPQPRSEAELAAWEELRGCLAPRFAVLLTGLTRNRQHDSP